MGYVPTLFLCLSLLQMCRQELVGNTKVIGKVIVCTQMIAEELRRMSWLDSTGHLVWGVCVPGAEIQKLSLFTDCRRKPLNIQTSLGVQKALLRS